MKKINVIGAGLAGSEAMNYLLKRGYEVHLFERRPEVDDGAHHTGYFGELVCSNSLKNKQISNACGLLKEEMRLMDSLMMEAAFKSEVPSGNALGVDRDLFAKYITDYLRHFPNLHIHHEEVKSLPKDEVTILATGPLTNGDLMDELSSIIGADSLSFFDASAPIVRKDSIDFSKAYFKSRYDKGEADYINCPFGKEEYIDFVNELVHAEKAMLHSFDTHYFESCLPIEVIASRGVDTLRYGPLKPKGLERPDGSRPYAVCQLRQDSKLGDYYNLVGFQTNLTYPEQRRVFRMIPGLGEAEFIRYGLMHRNSYINAPLALNEDLSLKNAPNIFVAGQLSGVEGYVESACMGIIAAINAARRIEGREFAPAPTDTMFGALIDYLCHAPPKGFAPMNANWAVLGNIPKPERGAAIEKSLAAVSSYWAKANGR